MFFGLFKRKKEKQEETAAEVKVSAHQIFAGMVCPQCGYMEVNEASNELPLEGFAHCPSCGSDLKRARFEKLADGSYQLLKENQTKKKKHAAGGHYRVRKAGPAISRKKGKGAH